MPDVVTYCRVSSDEQAHKDLSIPAQRKALARWIDERPEIELVAAFVDEGESAYAPAAKRPGLCRMIAYCRTHAVTCILVHKLDRFSRNREESILFKSLLRKHGVTVKSITEHYDPETPQGFLYEGMIEVINQFYSMNLGTETMKGMRENAERGYHNGGQSPYGYRAARVADAGGRAHTRLVRGPANEVETVREIFRLAVEESHGAKRICQILNQPAFLDRGVRTGANRASVPSSTIAPMSATRSGTSGTRGPATEKTRKTGLFTQTRTSRSSTEAASPVARPWPPSVRST